MGKIGDLFWAMHGDSTKLVEDARKGGEKAGDAAGQTFGQRLRKQLTPENIGGAIGVAFGTIGIAALKMGDAVDEAYDSIRVGTGATGEALEGLKDDFKAVAGTVTDDVGVTAQVLADLNTRTGATGETLQSLTRTILQLSKITGTDAVANVALATRMFGDWSVATEDQSDALDRMMRASQATGIGVDKLMTQVVQFGAPLRQMGFSLDEAAVILGKFEKEGVNAELVMGSMRIALGKFARAGREPKQALQETIAEIERLGPGAEATALAMDTFGARAGADMAAAILEGRFALGQLFDQVANGTDTIAGLTEETEDADDHLRKFGNTVTVALGDMFTGLAGISNAIGPLLYSLPLLTGLMGKFVAKLGTKAVLGFAAALKGLGASVVGAIMSWIVPSTIAGEAVGTAAGKGMAGPKALAAAGASGGKLALAMHKAAALAVAALPVLIIAAGIKIGIDEANEFRDERDALVKSFALSNAEALALQLSKMTEDQRRLMLSRGAINEFSRAGTTYAEALVSAMDKQARSEMARIPPKLGAVIEGGKPTVTHATEDMMGGVVGVIAQVARDSGKAGQEIPENTAQGILDRQGVIGQAMAALRRQIEEERTPAGQAGFAIGILVSSELANGLEDKREGVRQVAGDTRATAEAELAKFIQDGGKIGKKAMSELNAAMKSKDPEVREQARRTKRIIETGVVPNTKPAGNAAVTGLVTSLNNGNGRVGTAATNLAKTIVRRILGTIYTSTSSGGTDRVTGGGISGQRHMGGPVAAGQAYIVGEKRPELFVPGSSGYVYPSVGEGISAMGGWGGGGDTHVHLEGVLPRLESARDLVTAMRRINDARILPPAKRAPMYPVRP